MTDIVNTAVQPATFVTDLVYGLAVGVLFVLEMPARKFCKIFALNVMCDLIVALAVGAAFIFLLNVKSNGILRAYIVFAYVLGIVCDVTVCRLTVKAVGKALSRRKRSA